MGNFSDSVNYITSNITNMVHLINKCNICNVDNVSNASNFSNEGNFIHKSSNKKENTAGKASVFEIILVRIYPHSDWIQSEKVSAFKKYLKYL